MKDKSYNLSKYRLEKAREDLVSAKINFENKLYSQSINRSYYSIFHAVRALLAFDEFDSKKHSGIIAYFNQHYINDGKIDKKYSKILMESQEFRSDSDYMDFYIATREQAQKQIEDAEDFIAMLETYIKANFPH